MMSRISEIFNKLFTLIVSLVKVTIIAAFLCCAGYGMWNSLIRVRSDEGVVLEDYRRDRVVGFYGEGSRFFWQGFLPFLYRVQIVSVENECNWNVQIPIPGLEMSTGFNAVNVPVDVRYVIKPGDVTDIQALLGGGQKLESEIKSALESLLTAEIHGLIIPRYSSDVVRSSIGFIMERTLAGMKTRFSARGIEILTVKLDGAVRLPGDAQYARALYELAEIERVKLDNEKSLLSAQGRIKEGRLLNAELYAKLKEMSRIIRENPEILKYIYIDKMSDNVKIIISSDRSGLPSVLDGELRESETGPSKKREIDNLR